MDFALPFSAAVLLSICFIHIIPDTVEDLGHDSGLYILLGFILQLILEKYSHGIEHGHSHISANYSSAIFFGLGLHALLEGVPLGYHFRDEMVTHNITLGIGVHKFSEAFSLGIFLWQAKKSVARFVLLIVLFALVTPLSAVLFQYLGETYYFITSLLPHLVALSIGSFLWIATTIFYESEGKGHQLKGIKLLAIVLGFLTIIIFDMASH